MLFGLWKYVSFLCFWVKISFLAYKLGDWFQLTFVAMYNLKLLLENVYLFTSVFGHTQCTQNAHTHTHTHTCTCIHILALYLTELWPSLCLFPQDYESLELESEKWMDVNVVGSLLKSFFRKLPEPLITEGEALFEQNMNKNKISVINQSINQSTNQWHRLILIHCFPCAHWIQLSLLKIA